MADAQRKPFGRSLNLVAAKKAWDAIQQTGQALPCTVVSARGQIVTVKIQVQSGFTLPNLTVPAVTAKYVRYPWQGGENGFLVAAAAPIGGLAGQGGPAAPLLAQPSNLGALAFLPIGNADWSTVDPNSLTLYGPNGVVIYDTGKNSTVTLTPSGISLVGKTSLSLTVGTTSVTLSGSLLALQVGGALTINGVPGVTGTSGSLTVVNGIVTAI